MERPLLKLARSHGLAHPAKLDKFVVTDWVEKYEQLRNGQEVERGFLNGAVWLNNLFNYVKLARVQFSFNADLALTYDALIGAHVAAANHFFYAMSSEQRRMMEANPAASLEEILSYRSLLTNSELGMEPEKLNMHRLDSLCGPIWDLYQNRNDLRALYPDGCPHSLSAMDFFFNENVLVQMTHSFKRIWQELLYGGMEFCADKNGVVLSSTSQKADLIKAVYEYRRDHGNGAAGLYIASDFRRFHAIITQFLAGMRYIQCDEEGGLSLVPWSDLSENVKKAALYARMVPYYMLDGYLLPLFEAAQRSRDTSPECRHLLLAWLHLSVFAANLKERDENKPDPTDWDSLLTLCPRVSQEVLVARLTECMGLDRQQMNAVVEVLTYEAKSLQHDLWSRPLIKVDDDFLIPVAALLTASIPRNFDIWFQEVDPDPKRRGKLFERYLLGVLEECRASNRILTNLNWLGAVEFKCASVAEEIDLVFSFGNLLVVCELRSRRAPITPLDYHNDLNDKNGIARKANQALKKTRHVKAGLKDFCSQYFPQLLTLPEVVVMPLVIVSGQYHAGFPCNDVPVLDVHLLKHFLKDAQARFGGQPGSDVDHQYGFSLYSDLEQAQRGFAAYAADPALIKILRALVKPRLHNHPIPGSDLPPVRSLFYTLSDISFDEYLVAANSVSGGRLEKMYD